MNAKTINVSFPPELLKEIDRKAKEEYRSRSEFLKEASLFYIQTKDNWLDLQKDLATKAKKLKIVSEKEVEHTVDSLRS